MASPPPHPAIAARRVNNMGSPEGTLIFSQVLFDWRVRSRTTLAALTTHQKPRKFNPDIAALP
jgi:hypothetical protein